MVVDDSANVDTPQGSSERTAENDLSLWPHFYVLPLRLSEDDVHEIEDELYQLGGQVSQDARDASIFITSSTTPKRARFELNVRKVQVEDSPAAETKPDLKRKLKDDPDPSKIPEVISLESDDEEKPNPGYINDETSDVRRETKEISSLVSNHNGDESLHPVPVPSSSTILVISSDWLHDSVKTGQLRNLDRYTILRGTKKQPMEDQDSSPSTTTILSTKAILASNPHAGTSSLDKYGKVPFSQGATIKYRHGQGRKDYTRNEAIKEFAGRTFAPASAQLRGENTVEHDADAARKLPEQPEWVVKNLVYSCQRETPLECPNGFFVSLLEKIKESRLLTGDEIGVRAYSTAIASIRAYPHVLTSPQELLNLPGCDSKIASLFLEFREEGTLRAAGDYDNDKTMRILKSFYDIWGVGAVTAREWYYDKGWKDIDDVIEFGWQSLSRVQQIGVKYHAEFQEKLTRTQVEDIRTIVLDHLHRMIEKRSDSEIASKAECVIVGGYRRGKELSGDVDLIVSHPDIALTKFLIEPLVASLEDAGYITHTLTLSETNSSRDQQPLALNPGSTVRSGFDTLDKALVVWQEPLPKTPENEGVKNTNLHRRVDIIVAPFPTLGCAVAGWTSGTTFQRDLRRYVKKTLGFKFDSSGVRDRRNAKWVDLEKFEDDQRNGVVSTWQEKERRVFEGLGLEFIEPELRNTG